MSEFSESLHFRRLPWLSDHALHYALRTRDLAGVLLPVSTLWTTFISFTPFESAALEEQGPTSTGARLSTAVGVPVLEYHFAEDVYWAFLIWFEGVLVSQYFCEFRRRASRIIDDGHEPAWLEAILPAGTSSDAVASALYPSEPKGNAARAAGKRFAQIMQLGDIDYLGPDSIADRLMEMDESADVVVFGSPPSVPDAAPPTLPVKSSTPVALNNTALSARDAFAALLPTALAWAPDASLVALMASVLEGAPDERATKGPWLNDDGRTGASGGWSLLFHSATLGRHLNLSLLVETSQLVRVDHAFPHYRAGGTIADEWMDSDAIAQLTEPIYHAWRTGDTPTLYSRNFELVQTEAGPRWLVLYLCRETGARRQDLNLTVDAVTGEVTAHN